MKLIHLTPKNGLTIVVTVCVLGLAVIPLKVDPAHLGWMRWQVIVFALMICAILAIACQAVIQSRDEANLERNVSAIMAAMGVSPDNFKSSSTELPLPAPPERHSEPPGIDGEIYRIVSNPRTVSWELVRDIFRMRGEEPKVDTDILMEMYLVNASESKGRYVRDVRLSVEVGGKRVDLTMQGDLEAEDFADQRYEYGIKHPGLGLECQSLKRLFPGALPMELAPQQAVEGWVRFMAKGINPDNIDSKTWKISVLDSVGTEYFLTKASVERKQDGEIGLRRLRS